MVNIISDFIHTFNMKKFILIVLVAILEIGITSNKEHYLGKKSRKHSHVSLLFKSFVLVVISNIAPQVYRYIRK